MCTIYYMYMYIQLEVHAEGVSTIYGHGQEWACVRQLEKRYRDRAHPAKHSPPFHSKWKHVYTRVHLCSWHYTDELNQLNPQCHTYMYQHPSIYPAQSHSPPTCPLTLTAHHPYSPSSQKHTHPPSTHNPPTLPPSQPQLPDLQD